MCLQFIGEDILNVGVRTVGVGGWLAVLVVAVGVIAPLESVGSALTLLRAEPQLERYYGEAWPIYSRLAFTILGLRALVCLFVARQLLWEKAQSTPRLAIIGIWVALVLLGVLSLAAFAILSPGPLDFGRMLASMFWPVVLCLVATAYLLKSKRVAKTYSG
jgi:hypothetical protein